MPINKAMMGYPLPVVSRVTHLSTHMLNYLCRNEIVIPSASTRRGRGIARRYAYEDILLLRVIEKLLAQGISTLRLKRAFNGIQSRGGTGQDLVSKAFVVTDGKEIFFRNNGVVELLSSGQLAFAFVIELRSLRSDVNEHLDNASTTASKRRVVKMAS